MPCDTRLKARQTIQERAAEVRSAVEKISKALASGSVTAKVNRQGGIAFAGVADSDRDGVTDACVYRRLMVSGSALAKAKIAAAELRAGVAVDHKVLAGGLHSHDGGETWHDGH